MAKLAEIIDVQTGLSSETPKQGNVKTVNPSESPKKSNLTSILSEVKQIGDDKRKGLPAPAEGHDLTTLKMAGLDSFESYEDYMSTIRTDLRNPDVATVNRLRAERQSGTEQLGTFGYQLLPNIAMGLLETVGYIGDYQNYLGMMNVIDTDYDNWLSESMRKGSEGMKAWDPIYRTSPSQVWDPSDSAWWVNNFGGLVESIVEFGITGFGVGTGLKAGAKHLAGAVSKGKLGAKAAGSAGLVGRRLDQGAQLMTAASLAYTEGIMVGVNVYDTVYKEGIQIGKDKETAQKEASNAAATTVRMNMFNTALNYTAVGALFKSTKAMKGGMFKQFNLKTLDNGTKETFTDWYKRLKLEPKVLKQGGWKQMGRLVKEGGFESAEELVNEISQKEGEFTGRKNLGTLQAWEKDTGFGDRIAEAFTSPEGTLAMTLGFLGGVGNTMVLGGIDNVAHTYKNIKRAKQGLEPLKSKNELIAEAYQKELGQLIEKGEELSTVYTNLEEGVAEGNQEKITKAQQALSNMAVFSAFQNGTPDVYLTMLEAIEGIDDTNVGEDGETDAAREGMETNKDSPLYYKKVARQKINDLKTLQGDYDQAIDRYWMGDQETMGYAHLVFGKKVQIRSSKDSIVDIEEQITKFEQELRERLDNAGYEGTSSELMDVFTEWDSNEEALVELRKDLTAHEETRSEDGSTYRKDGGKARKDIRIKHGLRINESGARTLKHIQDKLDKGTENAEKHASVIMDVFKNYAAKILEAEKDPVEADALLKELDPKSLGAVHKLSEIFKSKTEGWEKGESKQLLDAMKGFKEFAQLTGEEYTGIVHGKALVKAQKLGIEVLQKEYDEMTVPGAMEKYLEKQRKEKLESAKKEGAQTAKDTANKVQKTNKAEADNTPDPKDTPNVTPKFTPKEKTDYKDNEKASTGDGSLTKEDIDHHETNNLNESEEINQLTKAETGQEQTGTLKRNALSMAYLAREYEEVVDDNGDTRIIRTVSTGDQKSSALHNDIESHTRFQVGDTFTVEVDPKADLVPITSTVINDKGQREEMTFGEWKAKENPTEEEIRMRTPLVIKDKNGEPVAYIHDAGTAYTLKDGKLKVEVDSNGVPLANFVFRRVVNWTGRKLEVDNWAIQTKRLKDFRNAAFAAFEKKEGVEIEIREKGIGHLIFNKKDEHTGRYKEIQLGSAVGPDTKLGVSVNGMLMRGESSFEAGSTEYIKNGQDLSNGAVYIVLPTPKEHQSFAAYVRAPQLNEIQNLITKGKIVVDGTAYANTIAKAIEIFMLAGHMGAENIGEENEKIVKGIKAMTKIDILNSPDALKEFVQLYVVDHAFTTEDGNAERGERAKTGYGQFHIRTNDEGGLLAIRFTVKDVWAKPMNFLSLEHFHAKKDKLVEALNNSQFAVNYKKLGEDKKITVPILTQKENGEYVIDSIEGKAGSNGGTGYEDFVKKNLLSKFRGEEVTLSDGTKEWVYFDQPTVEYQQIGVVEQETNQERNDELGVDEDVLTELFGPQPEFMEDLEKAKKEEEAEENWGEESGDGGILDALEGNDDITPLDWGKSTTDVDEMPAKQEPTKKLDELIEKILPGIKNKDLTGDELIAGSASVYAYILKHYDTLANSNKDIKASQLYDYALQRLKEDEGLYKKIVKGLKNGKTFSLEGMKQELEAAKERPGETKKRKEIRIRNVINRFRSKLIKNVAGATDIEANQERAKKFRALINNFDGIQKVVNEKLGKIGIKIKESGVVEYLYDFEEEIQEEKDETYVEDGITENYSSKAKLRSDAKNTAPWQIRLILSRLPKITGVEKVNGKVKYIKDKNYLGLDTFVNYEDLYNNLLGILVGTPEDFNSIVRVLKEYALDTSNAQIGALVNYLMHLDKDKSVKNPNQVKSQFVIAFPSKAEVTRVVAQFTPNRNTDGSNNGSKILTFSGDTQNDVNLLVEKWQQNLLSNMEENGLVDIIGGKAYISTAKAAAMYDEYVRLSNEALQNIRQKKGEEYDAQKAQIEVAAKTQEILQLLGIELQAKTALKLVMNPKTTLGRLNQIGGTIDSPTALLHSEGQGRFIKYLFEALLVKPSVTTGSLVLYKGQEHTVKEVKEGKVKLVNHFISIKNVEPVISFESKNPFRDLTEGQIARIRALAKADVKIGGVTMGTGTRDVTNQLLYKYSDLSKFTEQAKVLLLADSYEPKEKASQPQEIERAAQYVNTLSKMAFQWNSEWLGAFNRLTLGEKITPDMLPPGLNEQEKQIITDIYNKRQSRYINGQSLRNTFKVEIADGLSHGIRRGTAAALEQMTPKEMEIYKIGLFQNHGNVTKAKYMYMTPSENTVIPIIHALRKKVKIAWNEVKESEEIAGLEEEALDALYDIYEAEMLRIKSFQTLSEKERNKVKGYKDGGDKFIMFPFLNKEQLEENQSDVLTSIWDGEGNIIIPLGEEQKASIKSVIARNIIAAINEQVKDWQTMGMFKRTPKEANEKITHIWEMTGFSEKYMNTLNNRETLGGNTNTPGFTVDVINRRKVKAAAADYVVNYMFAHKEMFQVMSGDPAFYYKKAKKGAFQDTLISTFANLNKRLSEIRASGTKGYWHNPAIINSSVHHRRANHFNIVISNDRDVASKNLAQMAKMSKKLEAAYGADTGFESTDAQMMTTMGEYLTDLMAYGKISDTDFQVLTDKYEKQLAALKKIVAARKAGDKTAETQARGELEKSKYTDMEMKDIILQPLKPVYTGFKMEQTTRAAISMYLKTSAFPLVPQVVEGLEIESVLLGLEDASADALIYVSGVKTGAQGVETIFDKEGNMLSDLKFKNVLSLDRSGYKIQQENPYKGKGNTITESTQGQKMLFENLFGKSKNGTDFDYLRTEFGAVQIKILEKKYNEFLTSVKAVKVKKNIEVAPDVWEEVETVKITDLRKLRKILAEEAMDRGYPLNDILALGLTDGYTQFDLPLGFHMSSFRMEPLVLSLIKNKILKSALPGNTYIQGSNVGFKGVRGFNDLSNSHKSDIVWTPGYNPEDGLSYMLTKGNEVQKAQIIVPWTVKDGNGKLLRISDYTKKDENGKIVFDTDKVSDDVLDLFGFRIPLQGHSSMAVFEVVGYLPTYMADLAIVPDEIVTQMGSDFDVDKLSTYKYWTWVTKDGKIVKYASKEHAQDLLTKKEEKRKKDEEEGKTIDSAIKDIDELEAELRESIKGLQNRVVEIYNEVMSTPEAVIKGLTPLDEGKIRIGEIGAELEKLKTKNEALPNFITPKAQRDFYFINKDGQTGMGVFSLFNTYLALAQTVDTQFKQVITDPENSKRKLLVPLQIKFKSDDGKEIYEGNKVSDIKLVSRKGTKNNISTGFQSASMDNGNDQDLHKLNMNGSTFGIALAMISQGFDERYVGTFANQEVIHMWVNAYTAKISKVTEDIIMSRIKASEEAFNEVREMVKKNGQIKEDTDKLYPQDHLDDTFSLKEMKEMIGTAPENKGDSYWNDQLKVLEMLFIIQEMGEDISTAQNVTNTNQPLRHPGKTMLNALELKQKLVDAMDGEGITYLKGTEQIIGELNQQPNGDVFIYNPNGLIGANAMYGEVLATQLYKEFYPYESPVFTQAVNSITQLGGMSSVPIERKAEIFTDLKQYLNSLVFDQIFPDESLEDARKRLLYDEIKERKEEGGKTTIVLARNSLTRRIKSLQQTEWGKRSNLLKRLYPRLSEDIGNAPSRLEYMASGNEKMDEPDLVREFYAWTQTDQKVPYTDGAEATVSLKKLAYDLIKYAYATGGTQNPRNFFRLIPYPVMMELGYPEAIRSVASNAALLDTFVLGQPRGRIFPYKSPTTFTRQYFQHKPYRATKISSFDKTNQIKGKEFIKLKGVPAGEIIKGEIPQENEKFLTTIEGVGNLGPGQFYSHFLSFRNKDKWELYEKISEGPPGPEGYTTYNRISTLGTRQESEYTPDNPLAISLNIENLPEEIIELPVDVSIPLPNTFNTGLKLVGDNLGKNPSEETSIAEDIVDGISQKEQIISILEGVIENTNSDYHKKMATSYKEIIETLPQSIKVTLNIDGTKGPISSGNFRSSFNDQGEYTLAEVNFKREATGWTSELAPENQQYLEETIIIHELTHFLTLAAVDQVKKGIASQETKKIVNQLIKLAAHTKDALIAASPDTRVLQGEDTTEEVVTLARLFGENGITEAVFKEVKKKVLRKQRLTWAESTYIYPLISINHPVNEFTAGISASKGLRTFMLSHKIPKGYEEGKNIWEKLLSLLADLVESLKKDNPLAETFEDKSLYEAALNETLNLVGAQKEFYKDAADIVEDSEFVDPVVTPDLYLGKYPESTIKFIWDNTYQLKINLRSGLHGKARIERYGRAERDGGVGSTGKFYDDIPLTLEELEAYNNILRDTGYQGGEKEFKERMIEFQRAIADRLNKEYGFSEPTIVPEDSDIEVKETREEWDSVYDPTPKDTLLTKTYTNAEGQRIEESLPKEIPIVDNENEITDVDTKSMQIAAGNDPWMKESYSPMSMDEFFRTLPAYQRPKSEWPEPSDHRYNDMIKMITEKYSHGVATYIKIFKSIGPNTGTILNKAIIDILSKKDTIEYDKMETVVLEYKYRKKEASEKQVEKEQGLWNSLEEWAEKELNKNVTYKNLDQGILPFKELKADDPISDAGIDGNMMGDDFLDAAWGDDMPQKEAPISLGELKKDARYAAVFISKKVHKTLLEAFPAKHKNVYMHHSTIQFKPDQELINSLPYTQEIPLTIIATVEDEKGQALIIENPQSKIKHPHITVSTIEGVSSKYSNELIKKAIKEGTVNKLATPIVVTGKIGIATKKGEVFYAQKPKAKEVPIRNLSLYNIEKGYGLLNRQGGKKLFTLITTANSRAEQIEAENPGVTAKVFPDSNRGYIIVVTDERPEGDYSTDAMPQKQRRKKRELDSATQIIINSLNNQIKNIERSITRASSLENKEEDPVAPLEARIAKIKEQRDDLLREQTSVETLKIAKEQLNWADKVLDKGGNLSELDSVIKIIKSWKGVMNRVTRETQFHGYNFGDIASQLQDLETRWTHGAREIIGKMVNSSAGLDLAIKDIFGPQFDTGAFAAQTRGAFSSQVPIVRIVDKWLQQAIIRASNEFEGHVKDINVAIEKLNIGPGNVKEKFDKLAQKDENGELTGNLISRINRSYFQKLWEKRKHINSVKGVGPSNAAYKKHMMWQKENIVAIDIGMLIDGKEIYDPRKTDLGIEQAPTTAQQRKEYREQLIEKLIDGNEERREVATEMIDALLTEQKTLFDKFAEHRTEIIEDLKIVSVDKDGNFDIAIYNAGRDKWDSQNSPFIYNELFNSLTSGGSIPSGAVLKYNFASRYVPSVPAAEHWNKEFEEVMKVPELKEFYDFYVNSMEKFWAYLPDNSDIKKNRIPDLVKDLTEKYSDSALRGIISGANNSMVSLLTDSVEAEIEYGTIETATGQAMPSIPLWMTGETLMPNQKSYDLGKILKAFAAMATNYRHKARVEPQVLLANRLLGTIKAATKTQSGKKQKQGIEGDLMQAEKGLINAKAQLQYTIEALLYGMTKEPGTPVKILGKQKGFMGTEAKQQFEVVKDAVDIFQKDLATDIPYTEAYDNYKNSLKSLPKKVKSFIYAELNKEEKFQKKNKKGDAMLDITDENKEAYENALRTFFQRPVTGQSIGNALITYTQALGMGFNWFSATANLVFGTSAVFRHAAGKSEFTPDDARKAFTTMMGSTINGGKYAPTQMGKKVRALMTNFDGLAQVVESMYGSEDSKSGNWLYLLQERSEFFVYGQILVAMMHFNKVKNNQGEEKPLWDAFDENGEWNAKEFPLQNNEGWDKFSNTEEGSAAWLKFKMKYDVTTRRIHGNYDRKSPVLGKKHVLGRMLFQFRSWVPELWFDRWEDQRWDEALERYTKGTWRSYGTALEKSGAMGFATLMAKQFGLQILGKDASEFENLDEVDKINMRKNMAEIYFVAALAIALFLLGQIEFEDEDEEEQLYMNMGMTLLLNTFTRVNTEVTFFINPDAMLQMTKGNPAPAIGTLSDILVDMPKAIIQQLMGEGQYKAGVRKGKNKLLKETLELIPLGNQYYKFHYMTHTKMAN